MGQADALGMMATLASCATTGPVAETNAAVPSPAEIRFLEVDQRRAELVLSVECQGRTDIESFVACLSETIGTLAAEVNALVHSYEECIDAARQSDPSMPPYTPGEFR